MSTSIANLEFKNKIVIQVKSFKGEHSDLRAVEQIETAIKKYEANAGMIITTGQRTKELEEAVDSKSEKLGKPIDLLAGEQVSEFVIKNMPELIFDFKNASW